jgi:hypothetical protein
MIKCGIKLWTNNTRLFPDATDGYKNKFFDFVELYHNASKEVNPDNLKFLKEIPVTIHNTYDSGFHEFEIGTKQLDIWGKTKQLADYFESPHIIIHPGKSSSLDEFRKNLEKIDDSRILIENMAGLDLDGNLTLGYDLPQLEKLRQLKGICFDFEKAVKSACYQKIGYKEFISDSLKSLKPFYFHISGGNKDNCRDEHGNLWESNFDLKWIKDELLEISREKNIFLVFETPKEGDSLKNDIKNIEYFKKQARY